MMLGKRGRPAIKRTTSITEFTVEDLTYLEAPQPHQINHPHNDNKLVSSPRKLLVESTSNHFLRSCGLCNRRLVSGHDIYMYRGDGAFCSLECRQQQMNQDEMKDKFSLLSSTRSSAAAGTSTNGGTVAAA